jgi:hypothetical protein
MHSFETQKLSKMTQTRKLELDILNVEQAMQQLGKKNIKITELKPEDKSKIKENNQTILSLEKQIRVLQENAVLIENKINQIETEEQALKINSHSDEIETARIFKEKTDLLEELSRLNAERLKFGSSNSYEANMLETKYYQLTENLSKLNQQYHAIIGKYWLISAALSQAELHLKNTNHKTVNSIEEKLSLIQDNHKKIIENFISTLIKQPINPRELGLIQQGLFLLFVMETLLLPKSCGYHILNYLNFEEKESTNPALETLLDSPPFYIHSLDIQQKIVQMLQLFSKQNGKFFAIGHRSSNALSKEIKCQNDVKNIINLLVREIEKPHSKVFHLFLNKCLVVGLLFDLTYTNHLDNENFAKILLKLTDPKQLSLVLEHPHLSKKILEKDIVDLNKHLKYLQEKLSITESEPSPHLIVKKHK